MSSNQIVSTEYLRGERQTERARALRARALSVCIWRLRCFLENMCLLFIICYYLSKPFQQNTYYFLFVKSMTDDFLVL